MVPPPFNEADTRAKLIDPALHTLGWLEFVAEAQRGTHGEIHREQSAAAIDIVDGKARRRGNGRVDYLLRMHVPPHVQPLTLAFIEAKKEALHPGAGIEQVKEYAEVAKRQNVQFVFSTNGHLFVEYDRHSGKTSDPRSISEFPAPLELRSRYEQALGLDLSAPGAQALFTPYATSGDTPRYYQDAAIRAVLERLALAALGKAPKRALLSLATGAGKTTIAVQLMKRLFDCGQASRVLFVCDRDELRKQALGKFHNVFGDDAKIAVESADGSNKAHNARVHIATYQTLGVDGEEDDDKPPSESFLSRHYPPNHFSHIIIDECHRSAWGRWSEVLRRNPDATQIGLTATPRKIQWPKGAHTAEAAKKDEAITADNIRHFGEPVYEYTLTQGIEDGYLAPCEIKQGRVSIDDQIIRGSDVLSHRAKNARTGHAARQDEVRDEYTRLNYDRELQIPERLAVMCSDLFDYLVDSGGPEQKTIVFCTSDAHAQRVAAQLGNLYAQWCEAEQRARAASFAFQCTATTEGGALVADLRGSTTSHFIATTVDLLSTGVDVPCVRNIVFFRYLESPILFYQMVGRGTRIDEDTGKLMFRLYDYTNMIRLFGADFVTRPAKPRERGDGGGGDDDDPPPILVADGFTVKVDRGGQFVLGEADGKARPIPIDEYKARLAEQLKHEAADLAQFRAQWIVPEARHGLLDHLVQGGYSPRVLQLVDVMQDYDLFDVLARVAYASNARKRLDRMLAFQYRHEDWLDAMPEPARRVVLGVAHQFERDGTEGLENRELWNVPEIVKAGGLKALRPLGKAADVLRDAKSRLFGV